MSPYEVGTTIIALLSLLGALASAAHSKRSADQAAKSEQRAAEGERQSAWRELHRSKCELKEEAASVQRLCEIAVNGVRDVASLHGGGGGARQQLQETELREWKQKVEAAAKAADDPLPPAEDAPAVHARQIEIDAGLVTLRERREALTRKLREIQEDRVLHALRNMPVQTRGFP